MAATGFWKVHSLKNPLVSIPSSRLDARVYIPYILMEWIFMGSDHETNWGMVHCTMYMKRAMIDFLVKIGYKPYKEMPGRFT